MPAAASQQFPVLDKNGATVLAQTIPIDAAGSVPTANTAGEAHIGQIGGETAIVSASFARPADTNAYAAGDLVANSTTAGSVQPLIFAGAARKSGGTGRISRVRVTKSGASLVGASVLVHLFRTAPTVSVGDNAAIASDGALAYLGAFDVKLTRSFSDGAKGFGLPVTGAFVAFEAASGSTALYALIEANGAYTPASAETFTVALEVDRD